MFNNTPSERAHLKIDPYPLGSSEIRFQNPFLIFLKNLFGTPIPLFLSLYAVSVLTTMSGMEIFGWGAAGFTFLYIFIDQMTSKKEFQFHFIGADLWLWLLVAISAIGLILNAPGADFWNSFGQIRWILLLYLLTYSFSLFPGINRFFLILVGIGSIVALYGIIQHFTGYDIRYEWGLRAKSSLVSDASVHKDRYQVIGLFGHHLTYGYSFSMLLCFPVAAFFLSRYYNLNIRLLFLFSSLLISFSLFWTYGRGVWISMAASVLFMLGFLSRRLLVGAIVTGIIGCGTLYFASVDFQKRFDSIFDSKRSSNYDRHHLWQANIEMFKDHPYIGIGLGQNEPRTHEYFERLGINNDFQGHAHNSYLQWLSTTGALGLTCYMIFIVSFLLMTYRLWIIIPKTHFWHRVFVLGGLGAQVAMHTGGMTQWNFGDAEVNHLFILILALIAYLHRNYTQKIVADDQSL